VAAGEDQAEPVVGDFRGVVIRLFELAHEAVGHVRFQLLSEHGLPPDAVDGLVARGLDDPCARRLRHARHTPLIHRRRKCLLRAFFGKVEVARESDEGGDNPAPVGAIDRLDGLCCVRGHESIIFIFPAWMSIRTFAVRLIDGAVRMKYLLLIYADEHAWTDAERQSCYAESTQLAHRLSAAGQFLATAPLQPVSTATSVQVRDGKRLVTDGPFAETREQLGGYFLIDAKDLDEAIGIAASIPGARKGTVEIRPVVEIGGLP
jgi:hypothetical protein